MIIRRETASGPSIEDLIEEFDDVSGGRVDEDPFPPAPSENLPEE